MKEESKPKILISSCLGFEKCRYDGSKMKSDVVESLLPYVDVVTVCPETQIGLSTPRDSLRLINDKDDLRLYCPKTNQDYTDAMHKFSGEFLSRNSDVDGFILKGASPSCGVNDVKVYSKENSLMKSKDSGVFAKAALSRYAKPFVETDGRLRNFAIRDRFLTAIFTYNSFKNAKDLEMFNQENMFLLSSLSPGYYKSMSRNMDKWEEYEKLLIKALSADISNAKRLNTLISLFSFFGGDLLDSQKSNMFDNLILYCNRKLPYQSLLTLLWDYVLRYEKSELLKQTIFCPYPKELLSVTDSGKVV